MMNFVLLCQVIVILGITILLETVITDTIFTKDLMDYLDKNIQDASKELFSEPENNRNSIKYALYTPKNRKEACYIEPTSEEFGLCSFNRRYNTKFLIHGFAVILQPGDLFQQMKDALLDHSNYNIIIVDWTLYNNFPPDNSIANSQKIGLKVGEMIHFIMKHTGANPQQLHCIGHSLGAHICGQAARLFPGFGRVTGLDPGGVNAFEILHKNLLLKHTDATFVDAIHTSFILTGLGLGLLEPIGDMDFYVNGGIMQKHCKMGRKYKAFKGDVLTITTIIDINLCNHSISIEYFTSSIHADCEFLATKCKDFTRAVLNPVVNPCPANSSLTTKMGFYSKKIAGLPPRSVFYVDTLESSPYCTKRK